MEESDGTSGGGNLGFFFPGVEVVGSLHASQVDPVFGLCRVTGKPERVG